MILTLITFFYKKFGRKLFRLRKSPQKLCRSFVELCKQHPTVLDKGFEKAGGLQNGCKFYMFLFKNYPINSIENISLMFTWKHIYNYKYCNETLLCIPFTYAYRGLISIITHLSQSLTLIAKDILKILDSELKR